MDPYEQAREAGRKSEDAGGDWRDNPHLPGTREWYEYDDGRHESRRDRGESTEEWQR